MPTVQLNVRIDSREKLAGDAVLERFGVPAAQVIRETWRYMAEHQKLPPFMSAKNAAHADEASELRDRIDTGAGMALRLARETGIRADFDAMTYEQLRETAYEEMLEERGEAHV